MKQQLTINDNACGHVSSLANDIHYDIGVWRRSVGGPASHLFLIAYTTVVFKSFHFFLMSSSVRTATPNVGKVNRPTIFFYLVVAVVGAKISFIKSLSIFMKRETLQKRHKQSNKHVFRVCMHFYMYIITKVT